MSISCLAFLAAAFKEGAHHEQQYVLLAVKMAKSIWSINCSGLRRVNQGTHPEPAILAAIVPRAAHLAHSSMSCIFYQQGPPHASSASAASVFPSGRRPRHTSSASAASGFPCGSGHSMRHRHQLHRALPSCRRPGRASSASADSRIFLAAASAAWFFGSRGHGTRHQHQLLRFCGTRGHGTHHQHQLLQVLPSGRSASATSGFAQRQKP